jgi:hypothetical protein
VPEIRRKTRSSSAVRRSKPKASRRLNRAVAYEKPRRCKRLSLMATRTVSEIQNRSLIEALAKVAEAMQRITSARRDTKSEAA